MKQKQLIWTIVGAIGVTGILVYIIVKSVKTPALTASNQTPIVNTPAVDPTQVHMYI